MNSSIAFLVCLLVVCAVVFVALPSANAQWGYGGYRRWGYGGYGGYGGFGRGFGYGRGYGFGRGWGYGGFYG